MLATLKDKSQGADQEKEFINDLYDEDILDNNDIDIIQNNSKDNEKDDFER